MSIPEHLFQGLPDPTSAQQFVDSLSESQPSHLRKLTKDEGLLSDVLTLVAFSPLLATTLLQNPDYLWWLKRRRSDSGVRGKSELLESLARFELTNSQLPHHTLFARFRRRELLRIFLADIRRQMTVAEITEELSNLADAILENALRVAKQELDNRFGSPLELDGKGREKPSHFCVVSLGKLGSKELNYASDIDLMFLYSSEGSTSGIGNRGMITNREYFVKLAEQIAKLVGQQIGEGATFRVDLRLRPHGRVGPLAMTVKDAARYYNTEAANWEKQVMIRSRSSAGSEKLFRDFSALIEDSVFSVHQSVEAALRSVRLSKQQIDLEHHSDRGYDVKLGKGGIREIEFVAQALQLAYGGRDRWLRVGHTLISLSRLTDRKLINEPELTQLFDAYNYLRRLEHILQMENGLQTHLAPNEPIKRELIARRMNFEGVDAFDSTLLTHTQNVDQVFRRVFSDAYIESAEPLTNDFLPREPNVPPFENTGEPTIELENARLRNNIDELAAFSVRFAEMTTSDPSLIQAISDLNGDFPDIEYRSVLEANAIAQSDFRSRIGALRKEWSKQMIGIIAFDAAGRLSILESKRHQTCLAEASISVAIEITRMEMESRFHAAINSLDLTVMGLGKLGGSGVDYDSDLDLVLVYDDSIPIVVQEITHVEYFARAAEIFVNVLSSITREGSLYRVDLRLRPHGKNGPSVISRRSFSEYMGRSAAIWELLAFVKIRSAGGNTEVGSAVEAEITQIIHQRASSIRGEELASETRRIRQRLENERITGKRTGEVDIKYGSGGMLDIYFAIRFLQLRDNISDDAANRSSGHMLEILHKNGSLDDREYSNLQAGYNFLSNLDHQIRLTIGRATLLPKANLPALEKIAIRSGLSSYQQLIEQLSIHRIGIRESFESVVTVGKL
jgi:glutamate-ammonia-ligase adenylyltransferase